MRFCCYCCRLLGFGRYRVGIRYHNTIMRKHSLQNVFTIKNCNMIECYLFSNAKPPDRCFFRCCFVTSAFLLLFWYWSFIHRIRSGTTWHNAHQCIKYQFLTSQCWKSLFRRWTICTQRVFFGVICGYRFCCCWCTHNISICDNER